MEDPARNADAKDVDPAAGARRAGRLGRVMIRSLAIGRTRLVAALAAMAARARDWRSAKTGETPGRNDRKPAARKTRPISAWLLRNSVHLAGLVFALTSVGALGALGAAFLHFAPRDQIGADLWAVNRLPSIVLIDSKGDEIAVRGARYGEAVNVDDLPPYLIDAFLATEDRRFYDHHGVDLRGAMRAFWTNLKSGAVVEGGSTITQQLAKNLFLSPEQTYDRKVREALLAVWLEGHYNKNDILSLYLNRIYFGAGAYGIESAAQTYFGRSAREVSLAEAVMLAGLPKAPSSLAPTQNPFGAADRAEEVLGNLLDTNKVTPFDARQARLNPPTIRQEAANSGLGYFFDHISHKARTLAAGRAVDLVVTTTIDMKLQRDAEAAVRSFITTETKLDGAEQAALIAYDETGAMRAMVGGVSYLQSQFNRATQAQRQPGSAFKPFVYAAALENGMTPQTKFDDKPIDINGWRPTNYSNRHLGRMRLTDAMARSVNSVAVQVSERVGRRKVAEMARRLGIDANVPAVPSIALGAVNMSLEDLTSAYLAFARGGLSVEPYAIDRIADGQGTVLYERTAIAPERLLSERVSRDMNHLLYQVMHNGTGGRARLRAQPAVGKTGTTNDWRDAWFIGYTGHLTAGVWVGNDDFRGMNKITGGQLPAEIWRAFMTAAHQDRRPRPLPGAAPAIAYTDERALLQFYSSVARGFEAVRRDGRGDGRERRR